MCDVELKELIDCDDSDVLLLLVWDERLDRLLLELRDDEELLFELRDEKDWLKDELLLEL